MTIGSCPPETGTPPGDIAINLVDGATYVNGFGEKHLIEGATAVNPAWVYSRQGEWFDRETGRYVRYRPATGTYELMTNLTWRDLWKRVDR